MNTILFKMRIGLQKPIGKWGTYAFRIMALCMAGQILFATWVIAAYGPTPEHSVLHTAALGVLFYTMLSGGLLAMLKILKMLRKIK